MRGLLLVCLTSQIRIVPSDVPEANNRLPRLKSNEVILPLEALDSINRDFQLPRFHIRTSPSDVPEASHTLSLLKLSAVTPAACPLNSATCTPRFVNAHTRTVLSQLPEATTQI